MSIEVAKRSIDLILNEPGEDKLIKLFGGEPLLEFDLVKEITSYAKKTAKHNGKDLALSVCSNLTVLTKEQAAFIKDQEIKITVSFVGKKEYHDKFRFFPNGRGTYDYVIKNLRILSNEIPSVNLGISFVVLPSLSHLMFDNFKHIIDLSVSRNISVEIIEDFERWGKAEQVNFINNFNMIVAEVYKSIDSDAPIFLNSINWELARNSISKRQNIHCPFNEPLEIYPNGDMAFSPFVLNRDDKEKYVVGNVLTRFKDPYGSCHFDPDNQVCMGCRENYFGPSDQADNAGLVREFYGLTCLKAARDIKRNNRTYARYCGQRLY